MGEDVLLRVVLAVIVGVLFVLVYAMRVLILMERRVSRIEFHIERMVRGVLREELKIEQLVRKKKK